MLRAQARGAPALPMSAPSSTMDLSQLPLWEWVRSWLQSTLEDED